MRAASINDTHTHSNLSMCKVTKNFLQHQIICQVFDSRKKGLCVLGQLFGFFPRFVHKWGICPYKFEKNPGFFLESKENRRNFALS